VTKRSTKERTIASLAQAPRQQLIDQIMSRLRKKDMRAQIEWGLEVNDAAQEFRIGEAEGMPQFIRRLGAGLRAACALQGHAFDPADPRCLRCGEANPGYIPPAGQPDETLPSSDEVH